MQYSNAYIVTTPLLLTNLRHVNPYFFYENPINGYNIYHRIDRHITFCSAALY